MLGRGSFPSKVKLFYTPSVNQSTLSDIGADLAVSESDDTLAANGSVPSQGINANITVTETNDRLALIP